MLSSDECTQILKNVFWWFYIDQFKPGTLRVQADVLYNQAGVLRIIPKIMVQIRLGPKSSFGPRIDWFVDP